MAGKGKIMNRLQKLAWYQLIVIIVSLGLTAAAIGLVVHIKGIERGHIGLLPLLLLVFVHFDRGFFPVKAGEIVLDERDELFKRKAVTAAYSVFWVAFFLGCLVLYLILGPKATISVKVLLLMAFCGAIIVRIVWSVAIIVQYGRGGKDGQG